MTFKERHDKLLLVSIQKSNAFIEIVIREGQSRSTAYQQAKKEWEEADKEFVAFMAYMESVHAKPEDRYKPRKSLFGRSRKSG